MVDVKSIKVPLPTVIAICIFVATQATAYGIMFNKLDQLIAATKNDKAENKERFGGVDNTLTDLRAQAAIHNTRITVLEQTAR